MKKIGRMRQRVTIQNPTDTSDSQGGQTTAYASGDTVWAEVTPLSQREKFFNSQFAGDTTHSVRLRYNADVTFRTRFLYGTRTLYVVGPPQNVDERGDELVCTCVEEL